MGKTFFSLTAIATAFLVVGCETPLPPGAEPGPHGTMAYTVLVEASSPGVRIEANGEYVGEAPVQMKVFGDRDGTFHNFGSETFVIRALPVATNEYAQTRVFRTGAFLMSEDRIPERVYFDMKQPPPVYVPVPVYVSPQPYYYGPSIYFGPSLYYRHNYYHGGHHGHGHSSGGHGFKPPLPGPHRHFKELR
jgi:hypothetical protein